VPTDGLRSLSVVAVAMFMHWPRVTPAQYDAVMARLALDLEPAVGSVLHVATLTEDGLDVCDVWQTEQSFQDFLAQRLRPAADDVGLLGEPHIRLVHLHNLFAVDPHVIDRIGALSMPAAVAAWAA
jgi:hypothetical protein